MVVCARGCWCPYRPEEGTGLLKVELWIAVSHQTGFWELNCVLCKAVCPPKPTPSCQSSGPD